MLSGAAPLSAELAIACGRRLGCEVVQGYGMTELSPVSHATPAGMFKPGSVGVTVPNTEVNIVDPIDRVAARCRRGRRSVGSGPTGDEGLLEQRGRDEDHDRRRRLAAHRRHRPHRCRRPPLHRRPAQGADQVQGLPGPTRRTRGAAAHPSPDRRCRRDRAARRRSRRNPRGVHRAQAGTRHHGRRHPTVRRRARSPATSTSARSPSSTRYRSPPRARSCVASFATKPRTRPRNQAKTVWMATGDLPSSAHHAESGCGASGQSGQDAPRCWIGWIAPRSAGGGITPLRQARSGRPWR